jgi:hypothetical protein
MNMKLKLSMLAGVLALGVAGQASASITTGVGMADQLILSVWDPVTQTSYTEGLGLTINNLISGAGITFGAATNGSGFSATGGSVSYTQTADANLQSFLTASAADASSLLWSVVGGDVTGGLAYGTKGFVTTSNNMTTTSDLALNGMNAFNVNYVATVNGLMPAGSVSGNTDSVLAASPSLAYAGANLGTNFLGSAPFVTAAGLGQSQNFYLLTPATGSRGYNGNALSYQFNDIVTLASNGTLTIGPVAAVPEPGEWALMLSGFGLIGFVAMRRKNQSSGMTFA